MGKITTLAGKDLKLLVREKATLFWVIFFPLAIALFFGSIFSGGGGSMSGMKIAVIDEDQSDYSTKYVEQLKNFSSLNVSQIARDSATQKVRIGKLSAYLVIKKGFGEHRGLFSNEPLVEVGIDPARRMEAGYLQGLLTRANFTLLQRQFGSFGALGDEIERVENNEEILGAFDENQRKWFKGMMGNFRELVGNLEAEATADSAVDSTNESTATGEMFAMKITPVTREDSGPRSAFEVTFPSAILWALIGCAATFAVSIVRERTAGTYLRLRLAPITRAHILGGKGLACFVSCVAVSVLLILIGILIFGVRVANSGILAIGILSSAFCFVGLMMLISVLGKTEESVGGAAWGIMLVAAMAGGGMLPVIFMPKWLLTISHFSPVKWAILAVEGGIWRNFSLSEMVLPVGMLIVIGLVCYGIGVSILSRFDAT
jgi:ABC-2 type transport system permease protein